MDAKKQDIQMNPTGTSSFKLHFFRSLQPLIALFWLLSSLGMPLINIQATDADFKIKLAMPWAIFSDLNNI